MRFGKIYFHQPDGEMYVYAALAGRHQSSLELIQRILPMMVDTGAHRSTVVRSYLDGLILPLLDTEKTHDYVGTTKLSKLKSGLHLAIEVFAPNDNLYYSFPLYLMIGEPVGGVLEVEELFEQYVELRLNTVPGKERRKDEKTLARFRTEFATPEVFGFRENSLLGRDYIRAANISVYFNLASKKLELIRPILPTDKVIGVAENDYPHPTKPSYIDDSLFKPVSWRAN